MKQADRVISALLLFFAIFVGYQSLKLPYRDEYGPGSGFFPLWLAVLLAVLSILLFVSTYAYSGSDDWRPDRKVMVVTAMAAGSVVLADFLGMILTTCLFMGALLFYLEPTQKTRNLTITLLTPVAVWILFSVWLGVPMPKSPLGF